MAFYSCLHLFTKHAYLSYTDLLMCLLLILHNCLIYLIISKVGFIYKLHVYINIIIHGHYCILQKSLPVEVAR